MKLSIINQRKLFEKEEDIEEFIVSIKNPKEISFLELTGNLIHIGVSNKLSKIIKDMIKLKHLNFSRIVPTMPSIKMRETFDELFKNINPLNIQSLNISENALSWELPNGFCKFLIEAKNLEYLKINDCGLGVNGTILLLEKLVECKGKLKHLNISRNKITIGAEKIGKKINQLNNLKSIKINSNSINKESLDIFLEDIKDMNLEELDLTDNNISPISCSLLGKMFINKKMKRLQIGSCLIYDNGIDWFLKSWKENIINLNKNNSLDEKLKQLHLGNSEIINEIEINQNISSFLSINKEIIETGKFFNQFIDLSYNELTQSAINELCEFMKDKFKVKLLIFGNLYNDISELVSIIEKNKGLVIYEDPDEEELSDPFTDITEFIEKVNIIKSDDLETKEN